MRIVFLAYLHGFGGAEKQIVMLANALSQRGHDVTLVSISADNNCYELDRCVDYIFIADRRTDALRVITRYQDLHCVLETIRPDITVSFWFQSAYMTALMNKEVTGKVVYSERGDPGDEEYSGVLGLIRRLTIPLIDGFVFQSSGAQSFFSQSVRNRSTIIHNPVLLSSADFPPIKKRNKTIVTIGRLARQKNQALLIDAFALIANQIPEYKLEIYGEGELRNELQKQIDSLNLGDRAFLMGTSAQIHRLVYADRLFVLSSDYEGLPNTLLEAMALGIPCISTDCRPGGAREIIHDGEDGIIVQTGSVQELSNAMLKLILDDGLAESFSKNAIENCKRFDPINIYNMWEDYLERLIK